ncbi:HD-GYP domain-containing protein [Carbonactinospora thermoautotrophica]|uniref:Putative metal dependent phosphohydrolase n=1 Tax=Carbonactinospora thermoautotrophica TaxID=1469144 RepID=A0A132MNF0_9ACTN|nr:HD-GYP domain-containing protein [Carbonactinospora thermoautotrophica]KWW99378.1 putative metal dependent phosphohydrolase [Carbonactinospora thermoautotrophica]KWX04170.1 hypothetical protein TH66_09765 [Carbonactinospora thermoautotrophica]KWX07307.1 hypothetical protein TR74_19235 [Carbonactinospora thermoautotrophica]MCX9192499.1 HD-GYP domain-containing protein [Carbonactinospora thermoautotrophica]
MSGLPLGARAYVTLVTVAAVLAAVPLAWTPVPWMDLAVVAVLYLLVEFVSSARFGRIHLSLGPAVALAAVVLLPPSGVALIALLRVFVPSPDRDRRIKSVFNAAQLALAAVSASIVYHLLDGPREFTADIFAQALLPVSAAAAVYCAVNGLLITGIVMLAEGTRFVDLWRTGIGRSVVSYLGYSLIGLVMAVLWQSLGPLAAVLILLPLIAARWALAQYAREQAAYDATVRTLIQAVETKDYYTRGHSERVSRASVMIGRELGMREDRLNALRYAGILHDVGKLGVPTRLLQKSGPLTPDELEMIQLHPIRGVEIVREIEFLGEAYAGIMHHHERLDGKGYPMGLRGEEIPEFARVIAVADAFDSMTSTRSYRRARPVPDAIEELRRCAGQQFDPVMVEALIRAIEQQGWQPAKPPTVPPPGAEVSRYDHDDPTASLPVAPSEQRR